MPIAVGRKASRLRSGKPAENDYFVMDKAALDPRWFNINATQHDLLVTAANFRSGVFVNDRRRGLRCSRFFFRRQ